MKKPAHVMRSTSRPTAGPVQRYKGYVHQSNHAPAALQAEALRVDVLICWETEDTSQIPARSALPAGVKRKNGLTFDDHSVEDIFQLVGGDLHVLQRESGKKKQNSQLKDDNTIVNSLSSSFLTLTSPAIS